MSSNDRGIRKEVCWISSNITESSHQVQAVLDAGILPPLLKLLESQDNACREDATWVLYNISSNRDMHQINYLAEQNGIRALCNLLTCSKELDVVWKGCETVAAVALKGLRNILVAGQQEAASDPNGYNRMAALVADAHGVERIEALTNHTTLDVRQRARLLLERFFGAEPSPNNIDLSSVVAQFSKCEAEIAAAAAAAAIGNSSLRLHHGVTFPDSTVPANAFPSNMADASFVPVGASHVSSATCSCPHPHPPVAPEASSNLLNSLFSARSLTDNQIAPLDANYATGAVLSSQGSSTFHTHNYATGVDSFVSTAANGFPPSSLQNRSLLSVNDGNGPSSAGSTTGSTSDSDPEDDDSDSDILPPPPAACNCLLCTDATPLADRKPRKASAEFGGSQAGSGAIHTSLDWGHSSERNSSSRSNPGSLGGFSPSTAQSPAGASDVVGKRANNVTSSSARRDDLCHNTATYSSGDATTDIPTRSLCNFCSGGGRLGDGKAGLAAKLGRAVRLGHSHCVAILLSRMTWSQRAAATEAPALLHPGGGPPDGSVSSSLPAVVLAAHLGKPECLALLLRRCRPDLDVTHGKKRLTALAWAAHKGYMRCCALLLEHGASASAKCGESLTALHLAASGGGHVPICKVLLDHGAAVNARSTKKQTPLCLATQKGNYKLVRLLLEHGADCNNEDEGKFSPLQIAASNGSAECAEELIKAGARIDCKTRNGVTPLHYAVQGGHAAVVKLLVSAGAKVNCTKKPLLIIAADDGNREVVQILLDALAAIDCRANIKVNLDKDTEIQDKLTPLHLAASKGHRDVVELLLRRGAFVDAITDKGTWTALDFAILNAHAGCAIALLEHGATVRDNAKNVGSNDLTLVQQAARNGNKDVVRLLVQRLQAQKNNVSKPLEPVNASNIPQTVAAAANSFERHASEHVRGVAETKGQDLHPAPPSPLSLSGNTLSSYAAPDVDSSSNTMLGNTPLTMSGVSSGNSMFTDLAASALAMPPSLPTHNLPNGDYHVDEAVKYVSDSKYSYRIDQRTVSRSTVNTQRCQNCTPSSSSSNGVCDHAPVEADGVHHSHTAMQAEHGHLMNGRHALSRENTAESAMTPCVKPSSKRRNAKEDRLASNRLRERDLKKREADANEARERLEEAVAQKSVPKLSEAIAHVSKLVLNLATSVGSEGNNCSTTNSPASGSNYTCDVIERGYGVCHGPYPECDGVTADGCARSADNTRSVCIPMDMGLNSEVQKARKMLASLQAQERRIKEERAREVAELKRENSQQLVQKSINTVLEGGDVRGLNRTVNRALRIILDENDRFVGQARKLLNLIAIAEKAYAQLTRVSESCDIDGLESAIASATRASQALIEIDGYAAAVRAFGGQEPAAVFSDATDTLRTLVQERDNVEAERAAAAEKETAALKALEEAAQSGSLQKLEVALEEAAAALTSRESDAAAKVDSAKKTLAKALKSERRKLRQANGTKDVSKIDAAVDAAKALGVIALKGDIESSSQLSELLRAQDSKRSELKNAISEGDTQAIAEIRSGLEQLGMFTEAETARVELDNLQKASRARSLLSNAYGDAKLAIDSFNSRPDSDDGTSWAWPDAQRLHDLAKKSRGKFGGSLDDICALADMAVEDLAKVGRQVLSSSAKSGDTRKLAAAIASYEKSFSSFKDSGLVNAKAGSDALTTARAQLAELQAKEQEKVRAESAQVTSEYALAASRRSSARSRGARQTRNNFGQWMAPGSATSTNSSECGEDDASDADVTLSPCSTDPGSRLPSGRADGNHANNGAGDSECAHFYMWKEGTKVQCARCFSVRDSDNADWLQRVKKRSAKPQDTVPIMSASAPDPACSQNIREPLSGTLDTGFVGRSSSVMNRSAASSYAAHAAPRSNECLMYRDVIHERNIPGHMLMPTTALQSTPKTVPVGGSFNSGQVYHGEPILRRGAHVSVREQPRSTFVGQSIVTQPASSAPFAIPVQSMAFSNPADSLDGGVDRMSRMGRGSSVATAEHPSLHALGRRTANVHSSTLQNISAAYTPLREGLRMTMIPASISPCRTGMGNLSHENAAHCGAAIEVSQAEDLSGSSADIGVDFANENFGFDIDSLIINDNDR